MDFDNFQKASIYALVRLAESREKFTGAHIERTSSLCKLLTKLICEKEIYEDKVDQNYVANLCLVSPLHDIGKVGIPDAILLKPGKLTEEEFEIMKTHVDIGLTVIGNLREMIPKNEPLKLAIEVIKYHHEKWDGSGYPYGLKETQIPLPGRIMAIVDVYEALRSERVYKEPFSHEKSCKIIFEERGKHFDPELVDIFIEKNEDFAAAYDKKEHHNSYIA